MREVLIELLSIPGKSLTQQAEHLGFDRRFLFDTTRIWEIRDYVGEVEIVKACEDPRCSRSEPSPKYVKTGIACPENDELVTKPTYWVDSTWIQFYKSVQEVLQDTFPNKLIPKLGKIRSVFMLYCTRYIKKASGVDYHNCPICLPVKV